MGQVIEALPPGRLADEFKIFIESTTDRALFILSPDGSVVSWTSGSEVLTGWSREEIIGHPVDLLYTPADRALLQKAVEEGARKALRAGQIVRDLREFVARREVHRRPEHLPDIIEEACRLALIGATERVVRTFVKLDLLATLVLVDKVQVQQVLLNLLRNAEALTDRAVREITISTRASGPLVDVIVADTGPGVGPAIASRLFEAFVTSKEGGLGLSLSICRTIVEARSGRIWAEPRTGGGTAFSFSLPLTPGDLADE